MRVLTNGCSFSRGPDSWPYALQSMYNFELINLAQSGAGNTYIFESTVAELSLRNYDAVIIMWSHPHRIDYRTEKDLKTIYTSNYQHKQNDWPEKIIHPFNDQDLVQTDWVFGCGYLNNDKECVNLFDPYYKNISYNQMVDSFLIKVISLQSILIQLGVQYIFSFYQDYVSELKNVNEKFFNLINWANCCTTNNIYSITKKNNWFDKDKIHPGKLAHNEWALELKKHIEDKKLNFKKSVRYFHDN
jgi:hypothetical protein